MRSAPGLLIAAFAPLLVAQAAPADPAWLRSESLALPDRQCQELAIRARGEGPFEVRYAAQALPTVGNDPKIAGATLLLSGAAAERATLLAHHESGYYPRHFALPGPVRWMRRGRTLCIASGSAPQVCARVAGRIETVTRTAFGDGWDTGILPCAAPSWPEATVGRSLLPGAFPVLLLLSLLARGGRRAAWMAAIVAPGLVAGAVARLDPWLLDPVWVFASGLGALPVAIHGLRGLRRDRATGALAVALAALVVAWLAWIPNPSWRVRGPAAAGAPGPAAPPLWVDPAFWNPSAVQQSLRFRTVPVAEARVRAQATWLVVGGSVVYGQAVAPEDTFVALAESRMRSEGLDVRLLNAGVPGWNLAQLDRALRDALDDLPVDGLVLHSVLNNAVFPLVGEGGACSGGLLRAWTCNAARNYFVFTHLKLVLPKLRNHARYRETLRALLRRERALGRQVVIVEETSEHELDGAPMDAWVGGPYREIQREVARELGLPVHSLVPALSALPPDARFVDGIHLTRQGHAAAGAALAEILRAHLAQASGSEGPG